MIFFCLKCHVKQTFMSKTQKTDWSHLKIICVVKNNHLPTLATWLEIQ